MKIDHDAEMAKSEGKRKALFIIMLIISFAAILVFNLLTPYTSDDYSYGAEVRNAGSITKLLGQEYQQYISWTGRSVVHMILRIFLCHSVIIFKVLNSVVFVLLTLLIYWNVYTCEDHKYNTMRLLMITLLLWLTGIAFPQTVLWEVGACNYLWGTTIILSFVTLYRFGIRKVSGGYYTGIAGSILLAIGAYAGGVLAGWCNENTSGGGLLFTLFFLILWIRSNKGELLKLTIRPWMITGILGQISGLAVMVLAPGNSIRASAIEENHAGIYGMFSRVQKITLMIRDDFFWLIVAFIVCYILCRIQGVINSEMCNALVFFAISIITSYAMMMAPDQQNRAFFGAGIFMILAVVQMIEYVGNTEIWIMLCKESAVYIMLLYFVFTYIDCGAQNARIYRECKTREEYIIKQKQAGVDDITVPQLHKEFANRYTCVYESELSEDPFYWTNGQYEEYYGVTTIRAIPYDEWQQKYQNGK